MGTSLRLGSLETIENIRTALRDIEQALDNLPVLDRIFTGVGSPEGVVAAAIGSLYLRTDGGVGTALYVKESGLDTSNVGWAPK